MSGNSFENKMGTLRFHQYCQNYENSAEWVAGRLELWLKLLELHMIYRSNMNYMR